MKVARLKKRKRLRFFCSALVRRQVERRKKPKRFGFFGERGAAAALNAALPDPNGDPDNDGLITVQEYIRLTNCCIPNRDLYFSRIDIS